MVIFLKYFLNLAFVATPIFAVLKLDSILTRSWWFVLSPMIIALSLIFIYILVLTIKKTKKGKIKNV